MKFVVNPIAAIFFATLATTLCASEAACSSCLVSSMIGATGTSLAAGNHHMKIRQQHSHRLNVPTRNHATTTRSALTFLALNRLSTHFGTSFFSHVLRAEEEEAETETETETEKENQKTKTSRDEFDEIMKKAPEASKRKESESESESKPVTAGMVGAIGFYKNFISPLLPPACRFLPTCSQYGVQAINEYGPEKGLVLTAWRILRCSPFGGRGYDPPKWPPVFYTYGSY